MTTPYQGVKRCYGVYRCTSCAHVWKSAYSWADSGQMRAKCSSQDLVLPHKQYSIPFPDDSTLKHRFVMKYHNPELCGRCRIGILCQNRPEHDWSQLRVSLSKVKQFLKADSRKKKAEANPGLENLESGCLNSINEQLNSMEDK